MAKHRKSHQVTVIMFICYPFSDFKLIEYAFFTFEQLFISLRSEKRLLLDASYGSVILSQSYSEVSFLLPTYAVYGLAGHELSFNSTGYSGNMIC